MDEQLKKMMKMKMLQDLKEDMLDEMGEGFKPHMEDMKKVTVASDSKEGLEEGLDKAEEILKKRSEMFEDEDGDKYMHGGMKKKKKQKKK